VIVNTCSVTAEADRAARAYIRRVHRLNPEARIMVTGCYAQRAPEDLVRLAGVAAVVGNSHKALAPAIAAGLARGDGAGDGGDLVPVGSLLNRSATGAVPVWADDRFAHSFLEEAQVLPGAQTRPNLKIQEGCGNRCTFCVIPQTRGSSRSLGAASVLKQVEGFVEAGGKELVLSGINLGRWGRDLGAESLAGLVRRIFRETDLARLRLSSIEPMDWDRDLIGLMREFGGGRLARHAHLPLQSGSDAVLRRMHRRYRPWHYAEKAAALVIAAGPDLTLGADVLAGFPAETEREFEDTVQLIRDLPFGYLHLFPFSPRPGTRGWALHAESPVPARIVEERMVVLRTLAAEKSESHRRRFIGRELEAITLHTPEALRARGGTAALTENFLPVEMDSAVQSNQCISLRIRALDAEHTLRGEAAGNLGHAGLPNAIRAVFQ
jgi:threonylcarbamoyladenosine tRNA methylthiotransferase MtaB